MKGELTAAFMDALAALERERDVEPMVGLYGPGASIGNVVSPHEFEGPEGAREFWTRYRATFGEVESRFHMVIESDDRAALEWTTRGTTVEGTPVSYDGVSVLAFGDGRIVRFRAYFNPSDLGAQMQSG